MLGPALYLAYELSRGKRVDCRVSSCNKLFTLFPFGDLSPVSGVFRVLSFVCQSAIKEAPHTQCLLSVAHDNQLAVRSVDSRSQRVQYVAKELLIACNKARSSTDGPGDIYPGKDVVRITSSRRKTSIQLFDLLCCVPSHGGKCVSFHQNDERTPCFGSLCNGEEIVVHIFRLVVVVQNPMKY